MLHSVTKHIYLLTTSTPTKKMQNMSLSAYVNESLNVEASTPINECVIAAKKLTINDDGEFTASEGDSYVLLKHRDRAYNVNCSIVHTVINGMEIVYLRDDDTYWQEGMNANGVCIINSSLSLADEDMGKDSDKDKDKGRTITSKFAADGEKIVKALTMQNIDDAIHFATSWKNGIHGNTLFATDDELYTMTSTSKHAAVVTKLDGLNQVVFTNHSDIHLDAGYVTGPKRKSSVTRKKLAEEQLKETKTPTEMLTTMRKQKYNKVSHLNPLRTTKTLVTTSQMMLDPKNLHFHLTIVKKYTENFKGIVDQCSTGWVKQIKITYDEI